MTLFMRCILGSITALILASPAPAAEQVDLMLVLSSDVSRSIDHPKFLLQREGLCGGRRQCAGARRHQVWTERQDRALSFVEWSGVGGAEARDRLDDVFDALAPARKFGDQLAELPRSFADRTSIAGRHRLCRPRNSPRARHSKRRA